MKRPEAILLASASPRRRRLIGWLGLTAEVAVADIDEDLSLPLDPPVLACSLAAAKAVAARPADGDMLVLAFDTVVVLDGTVLGKPTDLEDAARMLRALSGRTHDVITGVAILEPDDDLPVTFPVATAVRMRSLTDDHIDAWIAEGELMGCAGAYNIERHLASVALDECFHNVAGLPLCHLYRTLSTSGARGVPDGLCVPVGPCDATLGRSCELGPVLCGLR